MITVAELMDRMTREESWLITRADTINCSFPSSPISWMVGISTHPMSSPLKSCKINGPVLKSELDAIKPWRENNYLSTINLMKCYNTCHFKCGEYKCDCAPNRSDDSLNTQNGWVAFSGRVARGIETNDNSWKVIKKNSIINSNRY